MRRIEFTITFADESGSVSREGQTVETAYAPDQQGKHRVAHILLAELKVAVGEQPVPKRNATAQTWLKFPNQPASLAQFFDIQNSQALWLELTSLIMGAEADLNLAHTFKLLEPPQEPSFDDETAISDLYYVHSRKMDLLNQSVYALIKVQDLVYRLLHESLGGDLVDTSKPDWETTQLRRENVEKGLETKRSSGVLSQAKFDAITQALAIPMNAPNAQTSRAYRNRMTHHIRPSVDYPMFFSSLESRKGQEFRNAQGKVVRRVFTVRARPPLDYRFGDLYAAFSDYLDAVVLMLQSLSQIDILRR
ncbi:MAG: hypothetical protein WCC22_06990 [Terriglobales bacterium]